MTTFNTTITTRTWTKLVDAADTDFLITWDAAKIVELASTDADTPPIINGHRFSQGARTTREDVGAGYVWARLVTSTAGESFKVTVSKTASNAGATGGFDSTEGVHKVAMMVWNSSLLTWERGTGSIGSGGGGGSLTVSIKNKKFDQASPTTLYIGEAAPGVAPSAASWVVKRITFGVDGFPASTDYAALGAATQVWDNRASLNY